MAIGTVVAVGTYVFNAAKGIYEYEVSQSNDAKARGQQDTLDFKALQDSANRGSTYTPPQKTPTGTYIAVGALAIAAILALTKG